MNSPRCLYSFLARLLINTLEQNLRINLNAFLIVYNSFFSVKALSMDSEIQDKLNVLRRKSVWVASFTLSIVFLGLLDIFPAMLCKLNQII